jgi:hypothetical protein
VVTGTVVVAVVVEVQEKLVTLASLHQLVH